MNPENKLINTLLFSGTFYLWPKVTGSPGIHSKFLAGGLVLLFLLNRGPEVSGQSHTLASLDEAIAMALSNNPDLRAADLQTRQALVLKGSSWNLPKTSFSITHGQYNSAYDNDNQLNITQTLAFPVTYVNQSRLATARIEASEWLKSATQNELIQQVKSVWYSLWMEQTKRQLLLKQDSIYERFVHAATVRYQTGESNLLEKATAEAQVAEINVQLQQNQADLEIYQTRLQTLLNSGERVDVSFHRELTARPFNEDAGIQDNPELAYYRQQVQVAEYEKSGRASEWWPELTLGYFNQSLNGPGEDRNGTPVTYDGNDRFTGFQVGLAIPLLSARAQAAQVKAAQLQIEERAARLQAISNELQGEFTALARQYRKHQTSLEYYRQNGLPQAGLILTQAQESFRNGDIGYVEYIQGLTRALAIRFNYLFLLNQYNQTIIQLEFLSGIQ